MLMSPAARRSVVGSIGFDSNSSTEEVKSPSRARAGRRSTATNQSTNQSINQSTNLQIKQPNNSIEEEPFDQPTPNKRRSRRLKDDPIIEEDDEQVTQSINQSINPSIHPSINQSNGDSLATQAELESDGPPPQPATNGWGGSTTQSTNQSINQSINQSNVPPAPFGRRQRAINQSINASKDDDVIADLAEIPDVEADIQEDLTSQIADSNHLRSHIVPALTELDAQLANPRLSNQSINQSISQTFDSRDIDLSLLFSCLTAPAIIFDSQNLWDFDTLLSEVQSEMYAEGEGWDDENQSINQSINQSNNQTMTNTGLTKGSSTRQVTKTT